MLPFSEQCSADEADLVRYCYENILNKVRWRLSNNCGLDDTGDLKHLCFCMIFVIMNIFIHLLQKHINNNKKCSEVGGQNAYKNYCKTKKCIQTIHKYTKKQLALVQWTYFRMFIRIVCDLIKTHIRNRYSIQYSELSKIITIYKITKYSSQYTIS